MRRTCFLALLVCAACSGGGGGGSEDRQQGESLPLKVGSIDFGAALVGFPKSRVVRILNPVGGRTTDVTAIRRSSGAFSFGADFPTLPVRLAPGESTRFTLTWAPVVPGGSSETLEILAAGRDPLVVGLGGVAFRDEEVTDFGLVGFEPGTQRTPELSVDVPADAISLCIEAVGGSRSAPRGGPIFLDSFFGPGGRVYVSPADPHAGPYLFERNFPAQALDPLTGLPVAPIDAALFQLPNTDRPGAQLVPGGGTYRFRLSNAGGTLGGLLVRVFVERRPAGTGSTGSIALNVFLAAGLPLTATGAPTDPRLQAILARADAICRGIGLGLGEISYFKLTDPSLDSVDPSAPGRLFRGSSIAPERRVNVFIVPVMFFGAAGVSGGLPGPMFNGTDFSGLAVLDTAQLTATDTGTILAHEIGHYLGLGHTVEFPGSPVPWTHDIIDDTCPGPGCIGNETDYLMVPTSLPPGFPLITPGQALVVRGHPHVSAAPPAFPAVTSLAVLAHSTATDAPRPPAKWRCATCPRLAPPR